MLVAIATVHLARGFFVTKGGYEFNLTILAAVFAVALAGPGIYSLDSALGIRLPEPMTLLVGTIALIVGVAITLGTRAPVEAALSKPQTT
jgi:putative oxidoreductase